MKNIILAFSMLISTTFAADAGVEQHVYSNDLVTLDATNSMPDRNGEIVKYKWKQIKRKHASKITLTDKRTATATFIAPEVDEATELTFRLKTKEFYNCKDKRNKCSKENNSKSDKQTCKKYTTKDTVSVFVHPADSNNADNNDTNVTGVSISGTIKDTNGTAIGGATVTIGTQTTTTDANGIYTVLNIEASARVSVDVTHADYLANSRIIEVNDTDITLDMRLGTAKATLTFSSENGATASHDGASVELPANGYVDSNGTPYTGNVTVNMSYYPITTQSGRDAFPGTFEGIDGNDTFPIQSYGFMNVELTDPQGNTLNLDGNSTATLTYPIDYSLSYPTTIPLWYYDAVQGYWVQEGEAVRTNYTHYVGTVTHFTSWNLDAKGPRAQLTGCVEDENSTPIANANVQFRSANWDSYIVQTDANGSISVINILARADLTFTASVKIGNALYYGEYPRAINLAEGEDRLLSDCVIVTEQTNLPGTITVIGTMTEYDYNTNTYVPVANATVSIYARIGNSNTTVASGTTNVDGTFSITFQTIDALIYSVSNRSFTLQPNKSTYDIGTISAGRDEVN